ncbi:protein NETWORKED 3C [Solanum lycopersicum]|uniref:NAB domain-containing protein n=1 Tax=Solanum lycopersicum TaxID=4081 RepID=A0A3Q7I5G9_SOLLC|nr:protein NETWORKED 3A [Solanum lycopersicum]XP_010326609.1 protein NETWORKED 3A [Solanum lycopersicum]
MVEAKDKLSSHWWWLDSQKKGTLNRSPWLQSTLSELDEKTESMLRIVEQDADSFAQRAEMYYKKRPQLINMVEDFYKTHRLLAEKYDQIKSESGTRLMTQPWMSPLSFTKYHPQKTLMSATEISYDSYSEIFDPESELSDNMSEVEDPDLEEEEEEIQTPKSEKETMEVSSGFSVKNDEVVKLMEEIEKLKEENRVQQELLSQKDEEKREVIRQLSLAMDLLREENIMLRKKSVATPKSSPKKENIFEYKTLKEGFRKASSSPKKESVIELKTFKDGFWKRLFN